MADRRRGRRGSSRASSAEAERLILDSGGLIGLARRDARARAVLERAMHAGAEIFVPAVSIAETVRGEGPRDAGVNRVLTAVDSVLVTDESSARTAGALLGSARSRATIDALVVAAAVHAGGGRILTGDADDLRTLARGRRGVVVHSL